MSIVQKWTVADVGCWLENIVKLAQYKDSFQKNEISGSVLLELKGEDLREIGVAKVGHRKQIELAIGALQANSYEEMSAKEKQPARKRSASPSSSQHDHAPVMAGDEKLAAQPLPKKLRQPPSKASSSSIVTHHENLAALPNTPPPLNFPVSRDDVKFKWLKSRAEIKANSGKFVELPVFHLNFFPKDFTSSITQNFFLTKQRAEILDRIINDFESPELRADKGLVLSGPHGMGKSCFTYLVASYAWVNKYPVLYIAACGEWKAKYQQTDKDFNLPAEYWLEQFKLLNEDILHKEKFAIVKQALNDNSQTSAYKQTSIMTALKKIDTRVFFIFDEHNELWKLASDGKFLYKDLPYWQSYTNWAGDTRSPNTYTIYSGSAHSKFLEKLPSGTSNKVVNIEPYSKEEFEQLVDKSSCEQAKQMFSNKHQLQQDQIELLTGRVPREMKILDKDHVTVDDFKLDRIKHFDFNINYTFTQLTIIQQKEFLKNLDYIFGLKISPITTLKIDEPAMDAGLLYFDSNSKVYKTLSNLAAQSLMKFFLGRVETNMVPIFSRVSGSEQGYELEQWISRFLARARFQSFSLNLAIVGEVTGISHSQTVAINEHFNSTSIETQIQTLDKSKNALIIADSSTFPAIDFTLFLVEQRAEPMVIFIQSTMSTASAHNAGGKDMKQLQLENGVAARILNALGLGKKCKGTITENDSKDNDNSSNEADKKKKKKNTTITLDFTDEDDKPLCVHYVYASGTTTANQPHTSNLPTNVTVLSREFLAKDWGVQFGNDPAERKV